jgi:hypothetical protein
MAPPLPLSESSSRESCPVDHHEPFFNSIGQKQTCAVQEPMSALLPIATAKADIRKTNMCSATWDVRFGPKVDKQQLLTQQNGPGNCPGLISQNLIMSTVVRVTF